MARYRWMAPLFVAVLAIAVLALPGCGRVQQLLGAGSGTETGGQTGTAGEAGAEQQETPRDPYFATLDAHLADHPYVYVGIYGYQGVVARLDSSTDKRDKTCYTGPKQVRSMSDFSSGFISELAIKPDGSQVYAAAGDVDRIHIIDAKRMKKLKTMKVADRPTSVAFTPDGKHYLVAHCDKDYVTVHDAKTHDEVARVTVGAHPYTVRVDFQNTLAYVGHASVYPPIVDLMTKKTKKFELSQGAKFISVIDLATWERVTDIETLGNGLGITWRPDGKVVYATSRFVETVDQKEYLKDPESYKSLGKAELIAIDSVKHKVIKKFPEIKAMDVAFHPDGTRVYALTTDKVHVIDGTTHEVIKSFSIGKSKG